MAPAEYSKYSFNAFGYRVGWRARVPSVIQVERKKEEVWDGVMSTSLQSANAFFLFADFVLQGSGILFTFHEIEYKGLQTNKSEQS